MDLADLWRGKITLRKVALLVEHLPPEAAIYRTGADDRFWSIETQFLNAIEWNTRMAWWVHTEAATKGGATPEPQPTPTQRLAAAIAAPERARRALSRAERFLARMKTRGGDHG